MYDFDLFLYLIHTGKNVSANEEIPSSFNLIVNLYD